MLAPLEMSVPAAVGLVLKGTLTCPMGRPTAGPAFLSSAEADPFDAGVNVTRWGRGLAHVTSRLVPGAAHAVAIDFDIRDELLDFLRKVLGVA